MTTFYATHSQDTPRSTAVDTLTYNENTQELVIDWSGELWKYNGISKATFDEVLAGTYKNAPAHASVGRSASKIKRDFGPGTRLGHFGEVTFVKADKATPTFPLSATKSAPTAAKVAVGATAAAAPQRFSLTPSPAANVGTETPTYTVDFKTDDGESREFTAKRADSVESAIAELTDLAEQLGVDLSVTGVYVSFVDEDE